MITKPINCSRCGRVRQHDSHGMCKSCASIVRMGKNNYSHTTIICSICGLEKPLHAKGLCSKCYRREHKKTWKKRTIICERCGKVSDHVAHGLCTKCYLTPDKLRRYRHRRDCLKRNTEATLTNDEWYLICRLWNYSCAYCGYSLDNPVQEHWIPSSRGGGYTASNIVPACPRCNSRKRSMTGDEFKEFIVKEFNYARINDSAS